MKKKILVTGGTGYIGSNLVPALIDQGHEVAVLSRRTISSLPGYLNNRGVRILKGSINNYQSLESLKDKFDIVYHLAASLNFREANKADTFKANVNGTENIAKASLKWGVKNFIFASSVEAVGPISKDLFHSTEDISCNPLNPYGESKLAAEEMLRSRYFSELNVKILRIANVYVFVHQILDALILQNDLLRYSDIARHKIIQPVHSIDLVDAMLKCVKPHNSDTYFIAGDDHASIGELFEIISTQTGLEKIWHKHMTASTDRRIKERMRCRDRMTYWLDMKHHHDGWVYSNSKAKAEFGYSPKIGIIAGINHVIQEILKTRNLKPAPSMKIFYKKIKDSLKLYLPNIEHAGRILKIG